MSGRWEMVVGLEVHCQLATKTKLFCACPTDGFGAAANSKVCPVCTGQPGVLPVLHKAAVEIAFQGALTLDDSLVEHTLLALRPALYSIAVSD
jgi:aspartyl-tRNA(Asn)/glutamyl-tRNA(Gln) amidotransferase subunit B